MFATAVEPAAERLFWVGEQFNCNDFLLCGGIFTCRSVESVAITPAERLKIVSA